MSIFSQRQTVRTGGGFPNHKELKSRGSGGSRVAGECIKDSMTYEELSTALGSSELEAGCYYLISDYQTIYSQPVTGTTKTGAIEPIIVQAISSNELAHHVHSTTHPEDEIHYLHDPAVGFKGAVATSKGMIYFRKDTIWNCEASFDFRRVLFGRDLDGSGNPTVIAVVGAPDVEFTAFGVPGVDSANVHIGDVSLLGVFFGADPSQLNNIVFTAGTINATVGDDNFNWTIEEANNIDINGALNTITHWADGELLSQIHIGFNNTINTRAEVSFLEMNQQNTIITVNANSVIESVHMNINNTLNVTGGTSGASGIDLFNDNSIIHNSNTDITSIRMHTGNDLTVTKNSGAGQCAHNEFWRDNTVVWRGIDSENMLRNYFWSDWDLIIEDQFDSNYMKLNSAQARGQIIFPQVPIVGRTIDDSRNLSTFECVLDVTNMDPLDLTTDANLAAPYNAGTPTNYLAICGIINVQTGNAAETFALGVNEIVNEFEKRVINNAAGTTINFTNATIQLGAATRALVGTQGAFIELDANNSELNYVQYV